LDISSASVENFQGPNLAPGWSSVDLLNETGVFTALALTRVPDPFGREIVGVIPSGERGVGVTFDFALSRNATLSCVNISAFDGISFWARTVPGAAVELEFDFISPSSYPTGDWYARPRRTVALTGQWRRYKATFADATLGYESWDFGEVPPGSGAAGSGGNGGTGGYSNPGGSGGTGGFGLPIPGGGTGGFGLPIPGGGGAFGLPIPGGSGGFGLLNLGSGGTGGAGGLLNLGGTGGSYGSSAAPGTIRGSSVIQALGWIHREKDPVVFLDDITFYKGQPPPISAP
jgi:hypothetical protein